MSDYAEFLQNKVPEATKRGIAVGAMPAILLPHQRHCVEHNLNAGSAGLFLDTGLGKTLCELEWSRQVIEHTGKPVLILCPLAVAKQHKREADKFGYDARVIRDQSEAASGINICNYDRLDRLDVSAFGAVALDESSILKNFTGKTTRLLIDSFAHHRFRLSATATPAPNDHMELGQHAEFCGVMRSVEMLSSFFINDTSTASQEWRLKRHGVAAFWNWMASWSRMATLPSDLGFSDEGYNLPPLNVHKIRTENAQPVDGGGLFGVDAMSATEMHKVKRQTSANRAKQAAELVTSDAEAWVIWCDTDYEADDIKAHLKGVDGVVEVRGSYTPEQKENAIEAFCDGSARILITKPSVCGFGLNFQHCARTVFVGRSFSYEAWYQAVRRFWRFGQSRPVECYVVVAEGEDAIARVIDRKAGDHDQMKREMAKAMKRAHQDTRRMVAYNPTHQTELPAWLSAA